jgi:hypothetical protein
MQMESSSIAGWWVDEYEKRRFMLERVEIDMVDPSL